MKTIEMKIHGSGYHASIKGQSGWEVGRSVQAAIGNLVISHPDWFGVEIDMTEIRKHNDPNGPEE